MWSKWISVTEKDLHSHIEARMLQRGITLQEIKNTLNKGWEASDAKPGISGKTMVYPYHKEWECQFHEEKEVTVYYKVVEEHPILLTVKARYGKKFLRGEK